MQKNFEIDLQKNLQKQNMEIAELLNCGTQKAVKLLKELDSEKGIGLIEKKRLGLGRPNVIYVKKMCIRDRCEAGSPGKRTGRKKLTKKGEQT